MDDLTSDGVGKGILVMGRPYDPVQSPYEALVAAAAGRAVSFPADGNDYPQYGRECTDTSLNGNRPLYPGKGELGFLGESNHSYRSIDFPANGAFAGYRHDRQGVAPLACKAQAAREPWTTCCSGPLAEVRVVVPVS